MYPIIVIPLYYECALIAQYYHIETIYTQSIILIENIARGFTPEELPLYGEYINSNYKEKTCPFSSK